MEHSSGSCLERKNDEELMTIISDTNTALSIREEALQILSKQFHTPSEQTEQ